MHRLKSHQNFLTGVWLGVGAGGGRGGRRRLIYIVSSNRYVKIQSDIGDAGAEQSLVFFHGSEQNEPDQNSLIWVHIVCSIGI